MDGTAALRLLLLLACAGPGGSEDRSPAGNRSVPGRGRGAVAELGERRFQTLSFVPRSECRDVAVLSWPGLETPGADAEINYSEAGGALEV